MNVQLSVAPAALATALVLGAAFDAQAAECYPRLLVKNETNKKIEVRPDAVAYKNKGFELWNTWEYDSLDKIIKKQSDKRWKLMLVTAAAKQDPIRHRLRIRTENDAGKATKMWFWIKTNKTKCTKRTTITIKTDANGDPVWVQDGKETTPKTESVKGRP